MFQLGPAALRRIAAWPIERRVELVHEVAPNPDNYDFVVGLAHSDPDSTVRAAALRSLFWHYPASDAPIHGWLSAPIEVQVNGQVLLQVLEALKYDDSLDEVGGRLAEIASLPGYEGLQISLAPLLGREVDDRGLGEIFSRLAASKRHEDVGALLTIAAKQAPTRLEALTLELLLRPGELPEWVGRQLLEAQPDARAEAFERVWQAIQTEGALEWRAESVGPLANRSQVDRAIGAWLGNRASARHAQIEADNERRRRIERLLTHVSGQLLVLLC